MSVIFLAHALSRLRLMGVRSQKSPTSPMCARTMSGCRSNAEQVRSNYGLVIKPSQPTCVREEDAFPLRHRALPIVLRRQQRKSTKVDKPSYPNSATLYLSGSKICNVRFGSKADIRERPDRVRFTPKSGHGSARLGCRLVPIPDMLLRCATVWFSSAEVVAAAKRNQVGLRPAHRSGPPSRNRTRATPRIFRVVNDTSQKPHPNASSG